MGMPMTSSGPLTAPRSPAPRSPRPGGAGRRCRRSARRTSGPRPGLCRPRSTTASRRPGRRAVPGVVVAEETRRSRDHLAQQRVGAHERVHDLLGGGIDHRWVQVGDPAELTVGQPDEEVQPERSGDLLREEAAEAPTADPAHDLAEDPAIGTGVVAVRCPGLPHRAARRWPPRPRANPARRPWSPRRSLPRARLVGHHQRNGMSPLPCAAKLGPVPRHRGVEVEFARSTRRWTQVAAMPLVVGTRAAGCRAATAARRRGRPGLPTGPPRVGPGGRRTPRHRPLRVVRS